MATVGHMGPFNHTENLSPGQSLWLDFGESTGFKNCALSVTATPHEGSPLGPGTAHVLTVENVNVTGLQTRIPGSDGLTVTKFHAGCNVTNTGETTITVWSVLVGVITP